MIICQLKFCNFKISGITSSPIVIIDTTPTSSTTTTSTITTTSIIDFTPSPSPSPTDDDAAGKIILLFSLII